MNDRTNDIILSGHNLDLTDAIKSIAKEKFQKLFEHENRIIRLRVDLGFSPNGSRDKEYWAKGHIDIRGNDKVATVHSDDLYHAMDELQDRLDRMLRRRARLFRLKRRHPHQVDLPTGIPKAQAV